MNASSRSAGSRPLDPFRALSFFFPRPVSRFVLLLSPETADGIVRFGSTVTLRWSDGRAQTVRLVGPDEADVKSGRLSIEAPLARALLDAREGSEIEVERPRGVEEATVESVR